jgi:hypothetical protein
MRVLALLDIIWLTSDVCPLLKLSDLETGFGDETYESFLIGAVLLMDKMKTFPSAPAVANVVSLSHVSSKQQSNAKMRQIIEIKHRNPAYWSEHGVVCEGVCLGHARCKMFHPDLLSLAICQMD